MFTIICPIFITIIIITSILFFIYFSKINKKYSKKIDILRQQIEEKNKKKTEIKTKSYYEFFRIVRRIFEQTTPFSLSVFTFVKNSKLQIINIEFIYQIKSDGGDGTIIFTGEYGQVPITNIEIISQLYSTKKFLIKDIIELDEYDNGLYEFLNNKGIKSMALFNIFNEKSKPIGFFTLTYKEDFLFKDDEKFIINETQKISKHLSNILK